MNNVTVEQVLDIFEQTLFFELDKGIDDMEAGKVIPHDAVMTELRQMVKEYAVSNR